MLLRSKRSSGMIVSSRKQYFTLAGLAFVGSLSSFNLTVKSIDVSRNFSSSFCGGSGSRQECNMTDESTKNDENLNDLWSSAIEGMINVPGYSESVLYLSPVGSFPNGQIKLEPWPEPFRNGRRIYCLTAHNPMGTTVSDAENKVANKALKARLYDAFGCKEYGTKIEVTDSSHMSNARRLMPFAQWHSFGFHIGEGWREDGFALSFDRDIRTEARAEIVKVAAEYQQGAIYEFSVDGDSGVLTRRVIWCDPVKQQEVGDEVTEMESLTTVPESNLAQAILH